jgi:hypothetical protein
MTREEQRKIKQDKKLAKIAAKEQQRQDKKDLQAWEKMMNMAKAKGAWID